MEYYNQDIFILKELGHNVTVVNRYRDIPFKFDVIFIWWWTYALYPVLLSKLLGRKSIITGVFNLEKVEFVDKSGFFARPYYQKLLIKSALKLTNLNLFVSKKEYNQVPKYFNLKKYFYYPCAIDNIYFNVSSENKRSGILNISWSGKDNLKRKGVLDILEAILILKNRGIKVCVTLAGRPGNGFQDLINRISKLGLEDQVETLGEVSLQKKLTLFEGARIYVQPSYFEGFGLATAEALASGCCIIACDVGEVKNVLGNGAYYVTPGNHLELANAFERILSDPNLSNRLVSDGQRRLHELYSQKNKKEITQSILNTLFPN
jgi:glycosyltransferase involved in cell wall biosynthesis